MDQPRDSFAQLKDATDRAQKAMAAGKQSDVRVALTQIKEVLTARFQADEGFDGIVSIQGVLIALRIDDPTLARELAECVLRDATRQLDRLNAQFREAVEQKNASDARTSLYEAYACAQTFIPRVLCPAIPWLLNAFRGSKPQAAAAVLWVMKEVQPQLLKANWNEWRFPPEVAQRADRAAAQTLVLTGNEIMQNPSNGALVEQSLHLGLNALALIPPDSRDQLMADCKNLLGQVYYNFGIAHQEEALESFEDCIAIQEALQNFPYAARDHMNAGGAALTLSLYHAANQETARAETFRDKAEAHLFAARDYFRAKGPKDDLRNTLVNLGALHAYFHNSKDAIEALEEAMTLTDSFAGDEGYYAVKVLGNLGTLYGELKRYDQAVRCLDQALQLLETIPMPETDAYLICYGGKGKLLCQMEQYVDAQEYLDKARVELGELRKSFVSEITNLQLLKNFNWIYEWSIYCLAALALKTPARWADAFELAESVKWRSLTVLLRYLPLGMLDATKEPLIQEEASLLTQLRSALDSPVEATLLANAGTNARLEQIWIELEPRYPEYVALRRQDTLSAEQTANLLDDLVPTLVEYYLGDETGAAMALVVHRGSSGALGVSLPASKQAILDLVRELRKQSDENSVEEFNRISRELHRILIEPLTPHLVPGEGVCFVPYGEMHNLSFATLFDGEHYLAERHAVVIAPCASALRWWAGKDRHGSESCLLFTATSRIREGAKQLPDLHLFQHLAETGIVPLFEKHEFVASAGTKAALIESLATPWDVAHIACHGVARADGLQSFLVMAGDPADKYKDLTAGEIATQVQCRTTLVTLSACESAVAEASTGDDVAGLAQAFLMAGSSSVLASNASVRQDAGVAITSAFYRYWLGKEADDLRHNKIEALKLAQMAAMNKRDWFGLGPRTWHPQQWGVFQLYGSWR